MIDAAVEELDLHNLSLAIAITLYPFPASSSSKP